MPTSLTSCPGTVVATLAGTVGQGERTYTAPSSTVLNPNTTYWLVVNDGVSDNGVGWFITTSNNETSSYGWTIGNDTIWRNQGGANFDNPSFG